MRVGEVLGAQLTLTPPRARARARQVARRQAVPRVRLAVPAQAEGVTVPECVVSCTRQRAVRLPLGIHVASNQQAPVERDGAEGGQPAVADVEYASASLRSAVLEH
eukprot:1400886-Prymnesium_polylepis.2